MATTANLWESMELGPGEDPKEPLRILVQTKTHLVQGADYHEKKWFILDMICQHHWKRDYIPVRDRWSAHGTKFGLTNRRCYFLLDHGETLDDNTVPVLWYEWTGEGKPL